MLKAVFTRHAYEVMQSKGFEIADAITVVEHPRNVYPSDSHPGQTRIVGRGLCLVGEIEGDEFRVITVYRDGVLTAPRPDQLATAEGRRYAMRFSRGLGRG